MTSPSDASVTGEGIRLHPMTLVHRALVGIPALIFILLPVFRSGDTSAWVNLVIAAVYGALVLPWMVVHYLRFRYWISPSEIVIHSGVLTRRRRNIPIDRIQNVDIERQILHRATGTSRVRIYTAGSTQAEGSLDVVSAEQARRFRDTVRALQRGEVTTGDMLALSDVSVEHSPRADEPVRPVASEGADREVVFRLSPRRAWLSGVFRFSLLYLAIAFSAIQYIDPNPELLVNLFEEALGFEAVRETPWSAAVFAGLGAVLLGWLSGMFINVNRFWGFELAREGARLYRRHGFLSLREGTIPLHKVQALTVRTTPLKRRFGWYALDAQTMGMDVGEAGHAVVVPFGRLSEIERVASLIVQGMAVWDHTSVRAPDQYAPVSRLTIRRALVRYLGSLTLVSVVLAQFWSWGWWLLLAAPALIAGAFLRYTHLGYVAGDSRLWVRSGVFRQHQWLIPLSRLQVIYRSASIFQRRLRLATVYVDTAGASPLRGPDIVDLPRDEAEELVRQTYDAFGHLTAR